MTLIFTTFSGTCPLSSSMKYETYCKFYRIMKIKFTAFSNISRHFYFLLQWNLSKPILIRTKEKYQFRQVIGLDRLTFELSKTVYKKFEIPAQNYIVYCCLDMWSIGYLITKHLVFYITVWNQLVVVIRENNKWIWQTLVHWSVWTVWITQHLSNWEPKSTINCNEVARLSDRVIQLF